MALSFFFLAIPDIAHITIWLACKTLQWTASVQTKYGRIGHFPEPLFFHNKASADSIVILEPFLMSPSPGNPPRFNTGKYGNKLKTSYFFPTSQDSILRRLIFSPIPDDLPGLTPITRNNLAKNILEKLKKIWIFSVFFRPRIIH